jgi:hypothetical protein
MLRGGFGRPGSRSRTKMRVARGAQRKLRPWDALGSVVESGPCNAEGFSRQAVLTGVFSFHGDHLRESRASSTCIIFPTVPAAKLTHHFVVGLRYTHRDLIRKSQQDRVLAHTLSGHEHLSTANCMITKSLPLDFLFPRFQKRFVLIAAPHVR